MSNPITLPVGKIVAMFGHDGELWTQGTWYDDGMLCMHEGIKRCEDLKPGDFHLIEAVADRHGWGTTFNDRQSTTWHDVRDMLGRHPEITETELDATFGPNWEPIVALVRRAATLTPDETKQLDAARYAARDKAGAAAWDAARHAARSAARDKAWNKAGDAAWYAARYAARDKAGHAAWYAAWYAAGAAAGAAAWALVVADLVGEHGFTQDHFDTLTAPWFQVCGDPRAEVTA